MLSYVQKKKDILILFILALLLFEYIFGFHLINFENIYWLPDDAFNGFLGWSFYRNTSETLPLFKIFNYGMGVGSTIIYTDSLPIMALIFKPFSSLLPIDFQYLGLWLLISYVMTSYFSNLILTEFGFSLINKILVTAILLLSPIVLERFIAGHFNLMSHWLILWGFFLYQKNEKSTRKWLTILVISILVHGYMFAMIMILAIFQYIRIYFEGKDKKDLANFLVIFIVSLISLGIFGYFEVQAEEVFHGGWGGYRLDLLSFINPIGRSLNWSSFMSESISFAPSQIGDLIEGFNYFGIGVLLNIFIAICFLIKENITSAKKKTKISTKVLIFFSIFMVLFALTNKITFMGNEIFAYNMPEFLKPFTRPFRASARFFWPVYYIILLGTIFINYRNIKNIYISAFFFVILILQTVDIYPGIETIRSFNDKSYLESRIKMDTNQLELKGATEDYSKMIYVFPEYANKNWRELIYFAYKNDKKTNFGYFARRNWDIQEDYIRKIKNQFNNMDLDSDSIYYFSDKKIYEELSKKVASISTKVIVQDSNGLNHMLIIPNK